MTNWITGIEANGRIVGGSPSPLGSVQDIRDGVERLQAENAALRKVAEAAELFLERYNSHDGSHYAARIVADQRAVLRAALTELEALKGKQNAG